MTSPKNMNGFTEKEWLKDFNEFVNIEGVAVPAELSQKILNQVHLALNPSAWLVFWKMLGVQAIVGALSLSICNQFDMNPFQTSFSLSDYFMKFGHSTCMTLCGVLFVSLAVGIARLILSKEEFLVLKKNVALQIFGLSAISLGVFAALGAEIALLIGFLWFIGAMIGGIVTVVLSAKFGRPIHIT